MTAPAKPRLKRGRVYRTKEFARWGANPTRLAKRLVREGELVELRHGLFYRSERSRFGAVPPSDRELMRAFLDDGPFLFSGPGQWNTLGLGSTAVFADQLVYNAKRSGVFQFGSRRFVLRRVRFPRDPSREWFAVDLLENRQLVGAGLHELGEALAAALVSGRLCAEELRRAAARYGTKRTQAVVSRALEVAGAT